MHAGRRPESPGLETNEFIISSSHSGQTHSLSQFCEPWFPASSGARPYSGLCYKRGAWSWGTQSFCNDQ